MQKGTTNSGEFPDAGVSVLPWMLERVHWVVAVLVLAFVATISLAKITPLFFGLSTLVGFLYVALFLLGVRLRNQLYTMMAIWVCVIGWNLVSQSVGPATRWGGFAGVGVGLLIPFLLVRIWRSRVERFVTRR